MKYIIKFSKQGYIKYISHLDMIRLFNRCFKRAGINLKHSQGFNPHPKLTFAQPLSLGYTSLCEMAQIETQDDFEPSVLKNMIDGQLPDGIRILSCEILPQTIKNIAADIREAVYEITVPENSCITDENIEKFLKQEKITAYKKQKRKKELKEIDIKPMVREMKKIKKVDDNIIMNIKVDCGSQSNLNPELLLKTFYEFLNIEFHSEYVEIQRVYMK